MSARADYDLVEMGGKSALSGSTKSGIILEWSNISYTVQNPDKSINENKTILHSMSGYARPQELLAVMGTSGAGKSTLLDVLAGRLESKYLGGSICTNGSPIDRKTFRKETGYVMQSDALFPLLTVRETFQFAAYLRIHNKTRTEKKAAANKIIKLLKLENCADTIIGDDDNRGLSGGEKRRVSIGVDIVHHPAVIFLDEPTSGLDSSTALSVIESLKQLAIAENCTVVMTIHQPSTRLFNIIDNVIFLSAGRVTYNGPVAKLQGYINSSYEKAQLGTPPMANPPEIFLDLSDQLTLENRLNLLTENYSGISEKISGSKKESEVIEQAYANSFFGDVAILTQRALTNILRTKELFLARVGACVTTAILISTLFLFTKDNEKGLNHRLAYFAFTCAFLYWTSLEALPIFLQEREIFQREYSRGAYRAGAYTIATTIVYFPFLLILSVIYAATSWWLVGLPNVAGPFFFHIFCIFITLIAAHTFSTMFSVLVPNPMAGQTAGSGLFSVMFLFSGFFIVRKDIPDYWIYLHYLSLFKYSYDSMVVNAFKDYVTTSTMSNKEVLKAYSVDNIDRGDGIAILVGFIIFFRIVFYYRLVTAFNGSRK